LDPDHRGPVVAELSGWEVQIGDGWRLAHVADRRGLIHVGLGRRLVVDIRGLWNDLLDRVEERVRKPRLRNEDV